MLAALNVKLVAGHASVIMPPSRNAVDGLLPGTPWSNGKSPPTGSIMPYSSPCVNGSDYCSNGQASFWFSQGCTIGCASCTGNAALTEECFNKIPLQFAKDATQWVRYADASKDVEIDARIVKHGGGKGWMRWPNPNYNEGQCDYVLPKGKHCSDHCPGCVAPLYAADAACPCNCDKQYPGLPAGNVDNQTWPRPMPGNPDRDFSIEDRLIVPLEMDAGEYVLGWRWDAEMTSQIWQSCSDVTVV